jgi:hypothetical protein
VEFNAETPPLGFDAALKDRDPNGLRLPEFDWRA